MQPVNIVVQVYAELNTQTSWLTGVVVVLIRYGIEHNLQNISGYPSNEFKEQI